jgi:drug/metabolite transporter (DMT)-like permease
VTNLGHKSDAAPSAGSQATSSITRRWTVIASGLLILALALVVIYTGPNDFFSPIALVVVAAIGLAAVLLQVWFRRELPIHSPLWLNAIGIVCAIFSLFADYLRITRRIIDLWAFAAVICFGISGSLILHSLRKKAQTQTQAENK